MSTSCSASARQRRANPDSRPYGGRTNRGRCPVSSSMASSVWSSSRRTAAASSWLRSGWDQLWFTNSCRPLNSWRTRSCCWTTRDPTTQKVAATLARSRISSSGRVKRSIGPSSKLSARTFSVVVGRQSTRVACGSEAPDRATTEQAYAVTDQNNVNDKAEPSRLWATTDGGRSWQGRAQPCPTGQPFTGGQVSVAADGTLGMSCAVGSAGAGSLLKNLWRSTTDGRSWQHVGDPGPGGYGNVITAVMLIRFPPLGTMSKAFRPVDAVAPNGSTRPNRPGAPKHGQGGPSADRRMPPELRSFA